MSPIKTAVALALASAAAASSAYALDASSSLATGTVVLNIGGSTAIDNTMLATETAVETTSPGGLCAANSIDVYQIGNPSNRLTYCTGSTTLPAGLSGVPIAIFKESNVGSFNGPGPLVGIATTVTGQGYQLLFLNAGTVGVSGTSVLTATNCPTVTTSSLGANFNTFTLHACSATASNIQVAGNPTGGIADVEANILQSPAAIPFPVSDLSLLTGKPGLDVVWTPVVTKNLYYALQTAEHLADGSVIASCNTANNDAPTCAPSLSKTQFASILVKTPALKSWTQFGLSNPSGDNNIYICRRDPGSGTEASYEQFFLGSRCGGASNPAGSLLNPSSENFTTVWENGSTGGVRNCLGTFFEGGTNTGFTNTSHTKSYPGGEWAVGYAAETTTGNLVLSSSNKCNDCFRAIAIDGVLPTLANVVNGFDAFFSTDVLYTTSSGPDAAGSGENATLFTQIEDRIGHPVFTSGTNEAYTGTPWGNGGDLAPAAVYGASNVPTIPATSTTVVSNPTNAFSKGFTGSVANCDTAVLQLPAPSGKVPLQQTLLGTGNVNH